MHVSPIACPDPATETLLDMAEALRAAQLPAKLRYAARRHLLDTVGAILAGMGEEVSGALIRVLAASATSGGLPVPGADLRLPPEAFAFLCGTAGHGIELDDGYRQGTVHPGVAVVPALLAASAVRPVTGSDLIAALVAGYETICALAAAAHPALRQRGFHPTPVAGPLGAAVAVGQILGLDRGQLSDALGIAASESGGLFAFLAGGGDVKRLHGGKAARGGLLAAFCAAEGIAAPPGVIGAASGFAQAFAGRRPGEGFALDLPPAGAFRLMDCYIKPHACCRHLQPAFEALAHLRAEHALDPAEINRIEIETYGIAAQHADLGWGDFASAQLSLPYLAALALRFGRADLALFKAETREGPWVGAIAAKLQVSAPTEVDALYPRHRPARVRVVTPRGTFEEMRLEALGCREIPLPDDALRAKFCGLAARRLGPARAQAWEDALWAIEECEDVAALLTRLCLS